MKKAIVITSWILATLLLVALLAFAQKEYRKTTCKGIDIKIDYGNADTLISYSDITAIVQSKDLKLIGKPVKKISSEYFESILKQNPYISDAEVYFSLEGYLKIKVLQRQPLVRVINENNDGYYLDTTGRLMPLHPTKSIRLLLANGDISQSYLPGKIQYAKPISKTDSIKLKTRLFKIYKLANFITKHKELLALIDQIYIDKSSNITLIPIIGSQNILFGNTENIDKKFENLIAFYKKGMPQDGWNNYKTINVMYDNLVVCSKK